MKLNEPIFSALILAPVMTVICCSIGLYIFTRIKIMYSKKVVQRILDSENLSDFEKGTLLLKECYEAHFWKSTKYKNELFNLTMDFLKRHNLELRDFF